MKTFQLSAKTLAHSPEIGCMLQIVPGNQTPVLKGKDNDYDHISLYTLTTQGKYKK